MHAYQTGIVLFLPHVCHHVPALTFMRAQSFQVGLEFNLVFLFQSRWMAWVQEVCHGLSPLERPAGAAVPDLEHS